MHEKSGKCLWMSCQSVLYLVQGLCKKVVGNVYLIVCIGDLMAVHGAKHYKHSLAAVTETAY